MTLLQQRSGAGNDYLGWIDLPVDYDKEEFARIKKAAAEDSERFRGAARDRYRRILSGSKSSDRIFTSQLLQCAVQRKSARLLRSIS